MVMLKACGDVLDWVDVVQQIEIGLENVSLRYSASIQLQIVHPQCLDDYLPLNNCMRNQCYVWKLAKIILNPIQT